jgi:predicted RNA-binding protein with RPS1 domain
MTSPNEEPRDDQVAEGNPSSPDPSSSAPATPPADESASAAPPAPPAEADVAAQMEASLKKMGSGPVDEKDLARREQGGGGGGDPLNGTVVKIDGNDVFVELGPRMQGLASLADFEAPPEVGTSHEFTLRGRGDDGLLVLGRRSTKQPINWDEVQMGNVVSATVVGQNTGGLELKIGPLAGFMPASQLDLHRVDDLGAYIGQKIDCRVLEVDKRRKRLLLSRRAILEEEVAHQRKGFVSELSIGQIVEGTVRRFETFGAFVELKPGVEGLLHVSNISRQRVKKPQDVLSEGQKVECAVLEIKNGGRRIGLGMKQLEPNPWDTIESRLPADTVVKGKVKRIAAFGAFVEIEDGVEGLVHISQLSPERIRSVGDAVKEGEEFDVRVLAIDSLQERVSLSRLTDTGHVIGSPEAESGEPAAAPASAAGAGRGKGRGGPGGGGKPRRNDDIPADVQRNRSSGSGTNLGALLRQALKDDDED